MAPTNVLAMFRPAQVQEFKEVSDVLFGLIPRWDDGTCNQDTVINMDSTPQRVDPVVSDLSRRRD